MMQIDSAKLGHGQSRFVSYYYILKIRKMKTLRIPYPSRPNELKQTFLDVRSPNL